MPNTSLCNGWILLSGPSCDETEPSSVSTSPAIPCDTYTTGGNANGAKCVFPFLYKSQKYYSCTTQDRNKAWCSTTIIYVGTYGYCQGLCIHVVILPNGLWLWCSMMLCENSWFVYGCLSYLKILHCKVLQDACHFTYNYRHYVICTKSKQYCYCPDCLVTLFNYTGIPS